MEKLHILGFCGSLRKDSYNKKLLRLAATEMGRLNTEVETLELKELKLPIFDQDIEDSEGIPQGGLKLIEKINSADALIIASPEYNGGVSGALKNAIDWASRAEKNPLMNKVSMIMGTSPGAFGASKSLIHLRLILSQLNANVIPAQVAFPHADKLFGEKGQLTESWAIKQLERACQELVRYTTLLRSSRSDLR